MEDEASRDAKISMLAEISGLSHEASATTLSMYDYNFDAAVNFIFEEQSDETPSTSAQSIPSSTDSNDTPKRIDENSYDEDYVREPIPPKRETLVMPEGDNFQFRRKRIMPSRSICPLRNFELEGRLQEEQLQEAITGPNITNHDVLQRTVMGNTIIVPSAKRSRLEYLYRPPVEICFSGPLQAARDYAQLRNRWLIVNLQDNTDFKCQILNRDIWSSNKIRDILQEYFIFWQVAIDNSEGLRFQVFYEVKSFPYVCILDPRTGEKKICYESESQFEEKSFMKELLSFLTIHSNHPNAQNTKALPIISTPMKSNTEPVSLTEDEQIALAIANSLRESKEENTDENQKSIDDNSSNDSNDNPSNIEETVGVDEEHLTDIVHYETLLGAKTDPITRLQLRLPDGKRNILEWPCTTKLQALKYYILNEYPEIPKDSFKIICPFGGTSQRSEPNTTREGHINILDNDEVATLMEANLHPTAILHVQIND